MGGFSIEHKYLSQDTPDVLLKVVLDSAPLSLNIECFIYDTGIRSSSGVC